jgi:hypothetical protein
MRSKNVCLIGCLVGLVACSAGKEVDSGRPNLGGATGDAGGIDPGGGLDGGDPGDPGGGACAAIAAKAEPRKQPADIVFGLDSSNSMIQEAKWVREQFNSEFVKKITASGIDVRVVMLAEYYQKSVVTVPGTDGWTNGICIGAPLGNGTCPNDDNPAAGYYRPTEKPVLGFPAMGAPIGSTNMLNKFVEWWPTYSKWLRPEATLTYVAVTDDDALAVDEGDRSKPLKPQINSADKFIAEIQKLDAAAAAKMKYSGIFCFTKCPAASLPGKIHQDLVTRTGGVAGDLCKQDFKPVFDDLAKGVIQTAKLSCEWGIPAAPSGEKVDPARVNVRATMGDGGKSDLAKVATKDACAGGEGWYYDDDANPTRVITCPASCTKLQADVNATVDVLFGCRTVLR